MAIVRWAPFDTAFDGLIRRAFGDGASLQAGWSPPMEVFERDGEMHVRLELPGIDPDRDVEIEVSGGVLAVSGERRNEEIQEGDGWYRREMSFGRFQRSVALPEGTDAGTLRATYDAGILDITVPLPKEQKTTVKVETGTPKQLEK
jgi:HSP20 family protein